MRVLTMMETQSVAGGDFFGDAMIRVGTQLGSEGKVVEKEPGGKGVGAALERTGAGLVDAGRRHNDTTSGGPPGGGPMGN